MDTPTDTSHVLTAVLDCRWRGLGGTGRATELLLEELEAGQIGIKWRLWGDPALLEPFTGLGEVIPHMRDPRRLLGQRDAIHVPSGDVVVYLHQMRPLRP